MRRIVCFVSVCVCLIFAGCIDEGDQSEQLLLSLDEFVQGALGDSLGFQSTNGDAVVVAFPVVQTVPGDTNLVSRRTHSLMDDELRQWRKDKGLYLYQYEADDRTIVFPEAVRILPAWMVVGDTHVVAMDYSEVVDETVRNRGRMTYRVILEATAPVETAVQFFQESAILNTEMVRTDETGAQHGYSIREWYTARVGLVKAQGTIYSTDEAGERSATAINMVLAGGRVRGSTLGGY